MGILLEDRLDDNYLLKQELRKYLFQITKDDFNEYGYLYTKYTSNYIYENLFVYPVKKLYHYFKTYQGNIVVCYKYKNYAINRYNVSRISYKRENNKKSSSFIV